MPSSKRSLAANRRYRIARRIRCQRLFNKWKEEHGCEYCGDKCISHLTAHHLPGSIKHGEVSRLAGHGQITRLREELDKCICLCKKCHAKEHTMWDRISKPPDLHSLLKDLYNRLSILYIRLSLYLPRF